MSDFAYQKLAVESATKSAAGIRKLVACCLLIALVWLIILPAAGRAPLLRQAIQQRVENGIDASAMFYTELPMMDGLLERNRRFRRDHPDALWKPDSRRTGDSR